MWIFEHVYTCASVVQFGHFFFAHIYLSFHSIVFSVCALLQSPFGKKQQWFLVHFSKFSTCCETFFFFIWIVVFLKFAKEPSKFMVWTFQCPTHVCSNKQVFTHKIRKKAFYAHLMHILSYCLSSLFFSCFFLDFAIKMCAFFSHSSDLLMTCTKRISQQIGRMHT